jgi:aldehyde dehydrogenase (NAD+)/betaine-aldehyde dehydrogenase
MPTATERSSNGRSRRTEGGLLTADCYIDGKWETGEGEVIEKANPSTEQPLGAYARATPEQVGRALGAARRAQDEGKWANAAPLERSKRLQMLVGLIESNYDDLLDVVIADIGTPVSFAGPIQLDAALENFRWFAEAARVGPDGWYEKGLTADIREKGISSSGMFVREPIGVVTAMTAYNVPYILTAWKVAGALAAGCSVIVNPSPRSTLCTAALMELIAELDLPDGVVNFLVGDAEVGRELSSNPAVDMVSFTGSIAVGAEVMAQASSTVKNIVLELGGKSPNVLLPGTDLEAAVPWSMQRLITNAGQRCGATSRIIVHESLVDEFIAGADKFLSSVPVGDPLDPETIVGPVIDERHQRFIQGHIGRALADGAEIVAGGERTVPTPQRGYYIDPVLLAGLPNAHAFCQEEQFGPVGSILTYRDVEEAVVLANASDFGLNASVFGPAKEAMEVGRRIRTGTLVINGGGMLRPEAPWGGSGLSGIGREGGDEGFRQFFEIKNVQWPIR